MNLPIPDSAVHLVAAQFGDRTFSRALDYVHGGRVEIVKPLPWPVVARVRGTAGYLVKVDLGASGADLRGECSCPVMIDCKHAAATALVVLRDAAVGHVRRADAFREQQVGAWLAELGGAAGGAEPVATAASSRSRTIGYVLDERDHGVGVTVVQCTLLKRGGLGQGTPIAALADPYRGAPPWVEVDDLRRIAMLRAVSRAAPGSVRLPIDRVHRDLLRELADAGQLFWQSTQTPLSYGPPRTEALAFRPVAGSGALHRLGLSSGLVVAAAVDCHYVDPGAGLIGPLELGVPAGLVSRLIAGPPVPASMRTTVERSLAPLLAPAAPAPVAGTPAAIAPRPRLVARVAAGPLDRLPRVQVVGEASYGDERLVLGEWDPARPLARDLVAEGRLRARLDALVAALPHGPRSASSRDVLADARHVAHVVIPALAAEGWDHDLGDDFPHEPPLVEVEWVEDIRPLPDGRDWFALELGVVVAGRTVPLLPILLQALRDGELILGPDGSAVHRGAGLNLRLPEGELVHVPAERIQRWLQPLLELELGGLSRAGELAVPAFVAAAIADATPGRFTAAAELERAREQLAALLTLSPRREERGFGGTLRDYQRLGVAWLRVLHDAGLGGVLADEMGLGKTVQVLAFLDGLRAGRTLTARAPALVVAPRSVVGNWHREALRFAPRLEPVIHLGAQRGESAEALTRAPLLITSYQTLLRDLDVFREIRWTTVLFDEAQAIKNPDAKLRGAAAALRADSRFCITGTPIENHLTELWSQVDLAMPGLLGRRRSFEAIFRRPIEKHGATVPLEQLRRRVRPFLLRRTKEGVALELPPKTEVIERVELDTEQRDLYESLRLRLDLGVKKALAAKGLSGSSMVILDALLKLRQCCCDPRLLATAEARKVSSSAKLERLMAMLEELADSGRRTLVFSQFTSMLDLIGQACERAGISRLSLTGATRDRDDVVRRFQAGEAAVLLISLKAGGVGLNLTAADTVIHYDPWWNPAAEAQAAARAHRIGQDRPVMVYKLVARGTLEETICEMQDDKRALTAAALDGGGVSHLAADDLRALYQRIV